MPSGSAKVLGTVRRATITDPNFYNQFFLPANPQGRLSLAQVPRALPGAAPATTIAPSASSGPTHPQGVPAARFVVAAPAPGHPTAGAQCAEAGALRFGTRKIQTIVEFHCPVTKEVT